MHILVSCTKFILVFKFDQYSAWLQVGRLGFESWQVQDFFCSPLYPIEWILGALFLGHETELSPQSSAKVKRSVSMPPLPMYLHGIVFN
jgi:hypothetical protein